MPKLDHLGTLFQGLCVEGSRCFDVLNQLLLITTHSHVGVNTISISALLRKNTDTDSQPVTLDSSWPRIRVISDGFSAVRKCEQLLKVAVHRIFLTASHFASRLTSPTSKVSFWRSDSKCLRNGSVLFSYTSSYVGSVCKGVWFDLQW